MTLKDGYFVWEKGEKASFLSPFFSTKEFECRCKFEECVEQRISQDLIQRLTWVRGALDKSSLRVHSGFRCAAYQAKLRGQGILTAVGTSTHELGHAADISSSKHIPAELEGIAAMKFMAIGRAGNFIHVDLRDEKVRRWRY